MHLFSRPGARVAHPGPARERLALYAAVAIAVLALVVAAYAAVRPAPQPPPAASVTVRLADKVTVNFAGVHHVQLGWIHVDKAPCVAELRANYTQFWFLLDGVNYGNPAVAVLQPGNHTVGAVVAAYTNGTKVKIEYRIAG